MTIKQVIDSLPPEVQREVRDFAEYLLHKHGPRKRGTPTFPWAGILQNEEPQLTSVELQHAFDADFDRTDVARKLPADILASLSP
jgi:hypothetical protein